MNPKRPFIHSLYCCRLLTSLSGSACAENVAFGVQYALQPSQPFPVSHATKNLSATSVIDVMLRTPMNAFERHADFLSVPWPCAGKEEHATTGYSVPVAGSSVGWLSVADGTGSASGFN